VEAAKSESEEEAVEEPKVRNKEETFLLIIYLLF